MVAYMALLQEILKFPVLKFPSCELKKHFILLKIAKSDNKPASVSRTVGAPYFENTFLNSSVIVSLRLFFNGLQTKNSVYKSIITSIYL